MNVGKPVKFRMIIRNYNDQPARPRIPLSPYSDDVRMDYAMLSYVESFTETFGEWQKGEFVGMDCGNYMILGENGRTVQYHYDSIEFGNYYRNEPAAPEEANATPRS